MKIKRFTALLLAVLLVISLTACEEKEPEMTDEEKIAYVATQLKGTSWFGESTILKNISGNFSFTINFSDDLTFNLYMESWLHGKTKVRCDEKCDSLSTRVDATGHNIGIEAKVDGWDVSLSLLCTESLQVYKVSGFSYSDACDSGSLFLLALRHCQLSRLPTMQGNI